MSHKTFSELRANFLRVIKNSLRVIKNFLQNGISGYCQTADEQIERHRVAAATSWSCVVGAWDDVMVDTKMTIKT